MGLLSEKRELEVETIIDYAVPTYSKIYEKV